jgi:PAS domain S-box-containing protein
VSLITKIFGGSDEGPKAAEPPVLPKPATDQSKKNDSPVVDLPSVELSKRIDELDDSRRAIVNVLEDLTSAKNEIEAAKAYDEALLASIADGVVATDGSANIVTANNATVDLTGFMLKELQGVRVYDVLPLSDGDGVPLPEHERPIYKALHAPTYVVYRDDNHFYRHKNGTLFPVSIASAPIIIGGRNVGAISVFRDITREKQIERAKTEFVSLASHQLRTPLTSIGWYAELLMGTDVGPMTEKQREYTKEIYAANKRMVQLVDALLNVSRIELGTFSIEPVDKDIVSICKDTISDLAALIARKGLKTALSAEPPSITMSVDPNLLSIILQNLLSNAIKYTLPGGTIDIKVRSVEDRVVIAVTDSGIGIPKEVQSKIFDKMYRADNARVADPDGNGLGLYLVKSIVDNSGGIISFVSEEGRGSTFSVAFPKSGMLSRVGQRRLQMSSPVKSLEELA